MLPYPCCMIAESRDARPGEPRLEARERVCSALSQPLKAALSREERAKGRVSER